MNAFPKFRCQQPLIPFHFTNEFIAVAKFVYQMHSCSTYFLITKRGIPLLIRYDPWLDPWSFRSWSPPNKVVSKESSAVDSNSSRVVHCHCPIRIKLVSQTETPKHFADHHRGRIPLYSWPQTGFHVGIGGPRWSPHRQPYNKKLSRPSFPLCHLHSNFVFCEWLLRNVPFWEILNSGEPHSGKWPAPEQNN